MKFSVVTPCRNAGELITVTARSITGQILSDGDTLEYIIIDGASTDGTLDSARKAFVDQENVSLRVVSEPDTGMYDALSKGLSLASGDVVSYLNAGDYYLPFTLATIGTAMRESKAKWLSGRKGHVNHDGMLLSTHLPQRYRPQLLHSGFYGTRGRLGFLQQEVMFWTSGLNQSIPFDRLRSYRLAGDFLIWTTFSQIEKLTVVDAIIGGHRRHKGQLSEDIDGYRKEMSQIQIAPRVRDYLMAILDTASIYLPERLQRRYMRRELLTWRQYTPHIERVFRDGGKLRA